MQILDDAARRAIAYLNSLQNRPVSPRRDAIDRLDVLDTRSGGCSRCCNVHSGAFDSFDELCPIARDTGAWIHIDGAFGLWARAAPSLSHLTRGMDLADSWATDAHKWLNVPYDSIGQYYRLIDQPSAI